MNAAATKLECGKCLTAENGVDEVLGFHMAHDLLRFEF
jgi:hypothetical protein